MEQSEIEEFVDRYLKRPQESRDEMMQELASHTGIDEASLHAHLAGEEDRDYLVERIRLFEPGDLHRTNSQLVDLLKRMIDGDGSTAEIDEWLRVVCANVAAPPDYLIGLIFHSESSGLPDPDDVLAKARGYRRPDPIVL